MQKRRELKLKIILQNKQTKEHIKLESKQDLLEWCYKNADDDSQLLMDMLNLPANTPNVNIETICKLCLPKGYERICGMPIDMH